MKRFRFGSILCLGVVACQMAWFGDARAADQRRVQHNTVACAEPGLLKKALNGHGKDKRLAENCVSLREGDTVMVEREAPPLAYVRPGGRVDHFWMPLEPVRWKKP